MGRGQYPARQEILAEKNPARAWGLKINLEMIRVDTPDGVFRNSNWLPILGAILGRRLLLAARRV